MKPGFGHAPLPFDRRGRDFQDFRGLLDAQSGKESQLDDAALAGVKGLEPREQLIQGEQVHCAFGCHGDGVDESHSILDPSAFDPLTRARMVDEDAAHGLRGNPEEVRAILPAYVSLVHQSKERFVDEGCRLQSVIATFAAKVARGLTS